MIGRDFEDYHALIKNLAGKWDQRSSSEHTFDDFMSEGHFAYMKALESYDPDRGAKFSTYLMEKANGMMKNIAIKKKHEYIEIDEQIEFDEPNPERCIIFAETINNLSSDAKTIISTILNAPNDFISSLGWGRRKDKPRARKITQQRLFKYMLKCGNKATTIEACFKEIKNALRLING